MSRYILSSKQKLEAPFRTLTSAGLGNRTWGCIPVRARGCWLCRAGAEGTTMLSFCHELWVVGWGCFEHSRDPGRFWRTNFSHVISPSSGPFPFSVHWAPNLLSLRSPTTLRWLKVVPLYQNSHQSYCLSWWQNLPKWAGRSTYYFC